MRLITPAAVAISIGLVALSATVCLGQTPDPERAVLYEENRTPTGAQYDGSVTWIAETVSSGGAPDRAVRACITIPERGLSVGFLLRRRFVAAGVAGYVVSIGLNAPNDFPTDAIPQLRGLLAKQNNGGGHGMPVTGDWLKVASNRFDLNLAPQQHDFGRNIQLLREQPWFSLAIVYRDGRRAIVAVEKGVSGEHAFGDAFAAWGAPSAPRPDAVPPPDASSKDQPAGCAPVVSRNKGERALTRTVDSRRPAVWQNKAD